MVIKSRVLLMAAMVCMSLSSAYLEWAKNEEVLQPLEEVKPETDETSISMVMIDSQDVTEV